MNKIISHDVYNLNADRARSNSGSFINNAFFSGFWHINSPTQLNHKDDSLFWKLVDSHHEGRYKLLTQKLLNNTVTAEEKVLIEKLISGYEQFCRSFGLPFTVKASAIWSGLYQARVLERCYLPSLDAKSSKKNSNFLGKNRSGLPQIIPFVSDRPLAGHVVYEIGPGSGFLTAILALKGCTVLSVETVQSHYCYQSAFYEMLFGDDFYECAHDSSFDYKSSIRGNVIHLPWWKVLDFKSSALPKADLVTSNHMLMECSEFAVNHYMALINFLLKDGGEWVFEGLGQMYRGGATYDQLLEKTQRYGFAVHDLREIFGHFGVWVITKSQLNYLFDNPKGSSLNLFIDELAVKYPDHCPECKKRISNETWLEMIDEGDSFQNFGI